jgi:hypothetical protein
MVFLYGSITRNHQETIVQNPMNGPWTHWIWVLSQYGVGGGASDLIKQCNESNKITQSSVDTV